MPSDNADASVDEAGSVEPGVWRYARATRATLVIDGEDYFARIQQAMLKARQRILLIGWDFDTRIHLAQGRRWWHKGTKREYPRRLGSFIPWLARHNPDLEIRILKWSIGVFKFFSRGTMMLDLVRWAPHRRIDFKFDTAHPVGCSHHQKIVVIDECFAVCGGIDMTAGRWDTREHLEHDPNRQSPGGGYCGPWHDVAMMMEGEVATALADLGHSRWEHAGGKKLHRCSIPQDSAWPDGLSADFENVEIGIARSRAEHGGLARIDEVEELFCRQIAEARHFIYAENQYFASRAIGEAIVKRLAEPDPPEVVIVHPANADGWVEELAMDSARATLLEAIRAADVKHRFHIYSPYSGDTPIYVHAKLMVVDDKILRVGSANFNNRSMGLDSECDVFIDARRPGNDHASADIRRLRLSLLAEHCGAELDEVERLIDQAGSMAGMIAALGDKPGCRLRPFHPPQNGELAALLAENEVLDPEHPDQMFGLSDRRRGLLRPGSLLARARDRLARKRHKK
ncbi:phospholipase D-like domain-containing protein [Altererythrobacter sp. KTW20L]|uniref:phospholipase D-like domain-containing protein n=1 Tax=Altererythrobacter sp. KTW20L TaxID=2942210 RepID=UPI0020BD6B71|nr:phospholipase D-like domain-containing protein [Altererythrobacter sp. KTW20L]MCL6251356.1 phospholipase D-like domain-containing protein [Altererythrobacter sp. KTW20L]